MASYRKRSGGWYVEIRKRGIYRSRTFSTKAAAKYWADEIEADIESGRPMGQHTLAQAMQRYSRDVSSKKKGARWERLRLDAFESSMAFSGKAIDDVTPNDLATWRDQRLTKVAASSLRRDFNLLNSVFEIARREWRWITSNPLKDVSRPANPPPREQLISEDQAASVKEAAGYWRGMEPRTTQQVVAAAFDLALETAMRAGEIRGLRGPQIHLAERYVDLPETKNGRRRQVPLTTAAVEILAAMDPDEPFPVTSGTMDATFRRIRRKAGLSEAFTFHDSRATAITRLAKRLDIHDLARMTGHRDLSMLTRYYRATASEIAQRLD
ncbi:site-specific integrase [Salinisphaera sp. SPP-AMP-43]|uniref:tyrosine-type recombinase/integrase n=1 Tax=Salinisphaera sp. SPP-AMP-43 TaxID=3121288 RepID=UPI003C6E89CE